MSWQNTDKRLIPAIIHWEKSTVCWQLKLSGNLLLINVHGRSSARRNLLYKHFLCRFMNAHISNEGFTCTWRTTHTEVSPTQCRGSQEKGANSGRLSPLTYRREWHRLPQELFHDNQWSPWTANLWDKIMKQQLSFDRSTAPRVAPTIILIESFVLGQWSRMLIFSRFVFLVCVLIVLSWFREGCPEFRSTKLKSRRIHWNGPSAESKTGWKQTSIPCFPRQARLTMMPPLPLLTRSSHCSLAFLVPWPAVSTKGNFSAAPRCFYSLNNGPFQATWRQTVDYKHKGKHQTPTEAILHQSNKAWFAFTMRANHQKIIPKVETPSVPKWIALRVCCNDKLGKAIYKPNYEAEFPGVSSSV